jgi:hypothetical protein
MELPSTSKAGQGEKERGLRYVKLNVFAGRSGKLIE